MSARPAGWLLKPVVVALLVAQVCFAQQPVTSVAVPSIAAAYRRHGDADESVPVAITPDLVSENILEIALRLAHALNVERWAQLKFDLQLYSSVEDPAEGAPLYCPVWARSSKSEELERVLVFARGRPEWQKATRNLEPWSKVGVKLWGDTGGVLPGYSPVQGGLSDGRLAIGQLAARVRHNKQKGVIWDVVRATAIRGQFSDEQLLSLLDGVQCWRAEDHGLGDDWSFGAKREVAVSGRELHWRPMGDFCRRMGTMCKDVRRGPAKGALELERKIIHLEGWAMQHAACCDIAAKAIKKGARVVSGSDAEMLTLLLRASASLSAGLSREPSTLAIVQDLETIERRDYAMFRWGVGRQR